MAISKVTVGALACASLIAGAAIADDLGDNTLELPREVVSAATAFESYMRGAAAIGPFSGGASVEQGLRGGVAYEPVQLEEGMIAYGALAALQDEAFVEGVRRAAADEGARQALADRLVDNPYEATGVDGADEALRRVSAALGARAAPLAMAGAQVTAAAYSVQHQAWSRATVSDAQGRLAEVKRLSAVRYQPSQSESQEMIRELVAGTDSGAVAGGAPGSATAVEARALALAAESVIGHAGGADRERLAPLLSEPRSAECLKMAKLNLYQCMAVAGPEYEDIFCLGRHGMSDTGACVAEAAHGRAPADVATGSPVDRGVYLPVAAHRSSRIDPDQ